MKIKYIFLLYAILTISLLLIVKVWNLILYWDIFLTLAFYGNIHINYTLCYKDKNVLENKYNNLVTHPKFDIIIWLCKLFHLEKLRLCLCMRSYQRIEYENDSTLIRKRTFSWEYIYIWWLNIATIDNNIQNYFLILKIYIYIYIHFNI